jgi:cyclophilin family peptidyl-prolyl cis-trans isomerase
MKKLLLTILPVLALLSCSSKSQSDSNSEDMQSADSVTGATTAAEAAIDDVKVLIKTSEGDIEVLLYGDTPRHCRNFVELVNKGYYDGTLFHRVIKDFMIQGGDPDSNGAPAGKQLGEGGPGYEIPAEFVYPKHFHKYGALAAARTGDQINPERKSSGSQFYIVTGTKYSEADLNRMEQQLKQGQAQTIFYQIAQQRRTEIEALQNKGDRDGLQKLQQEIIDQATAQADRFSFTDEQRKAYTTVGGTPHLDGSYTVFGEVISGMDVVEKIQNVKTDRGDRPVEDVKIISTKIIE